MASSDARAHGRNRRPALAGRRAGPRHFHSAAFNEAQPTFFGAPPPAAAVDAAGSFVGDVRHGGSCNCSIHTLAPHCNGTHTECVGHVTHGTLERSRPQPRAFQRRAARLREPEPRADDRRSRQRAALDTQAVASAAHVASLPRAGRAHAAERRATSCSRNYDTDRRRPTSMLTRCAGSSRNGITTFVVDLPSIDRAHDRRTLAAHRIFWGMPPGATTRCAGHAADTRRSRSWRSSTTPSPTGRIC